VLNPAWVYGNGLFVFCLTHTIWNIHGVATNSVCRELDGTSFVVDETEPNTITGRSPHHPHDGEFWMICMGYAPLDLRRILSRYPRKNEVPPPADLLAASAEAAMKVLSKLQTEKAGEKAADKIHEAKTAERK
jgi:hypothetical protein